MMTASISIGISRVRIQSLGSWGCFDRQGGLGMIIDWLSRTQTAEAEA
jgi:hypothetical protein